MYNPVVLRLALVVMLLSACVHTRAPSLDEGVVAEDFTLTSDTNEAVRLSEVNDDKWAVLVFYRGFW